MMVAYYNEINPKAATWLRELIKQNLIAPGDVDERSIVDVKPEAGLTVLEYNTGGLFGGGIDLTVGPEKLPVTGILVTNLPSLNLKKNL